MPVDPRARWIENPFLVLGLPPDVSRKDMEREGAKLLALLGVGAARAKTYETPFGARERTADLVRAAMAELRDPEKRILHEPWATTAPAASPATPALEAWADADAALGLRRRG